MGIFEETMSQLKLTPRPQQTKLVNFIRDTVTNETVKFVQAGTGTGKSYAVLTTALEAAHETGLPSVVVCPNNTLIDQYVNKDAPHIGAVAGGKFAHIKGRGRYLCANSRAIQRRTSSDRQAHQEYRTLTRGGKFEWAELGLDSEHGCPGGLDCNRSKSIDNSLCGLHSPDSNRSPDASCDCLIVCGAFEAKRRASTADVIVTNAHVLVWDYLVRGFTHGAAELLPDAGALFVDECHELETVGRDCLSDEIKPGSSVYDVVEGLRQWVQEATSRLVRADQSEALLNRDGYVMKLAEQAAVDALDLERRADTEGVDYDLAIEYRKEAKRIRRFVDFVADDPAFISTIETAHDPINHTHVTTLRRRCIDARRMFNDILTRQPSVLVSGTIPTTATVRLGVKCSIENVGHPFDYSKSTLAISPHSPKDRSHFRNRVEQVAQAINDTNGGTLLLFTSWADLELVTSMVADRLNPGIDVFVQSKDDPATLKQDVEDFKANGNAVLVGVRSLFTGLDVPGPALRQVIVWKLPYSVPTLEVKAIQNVYGRQAYFDQMLTVLTQGIGRLVRTVDDKGRVFICDSRASNQQWRRNHMTAHVSEFSAHRRPRR